MAVVLAAGAARISAIALVHALGLLPTVASDTYYYVDAAEHWAGIEGDGTFDGTNFERYRGYVVPLGVLFRVVGSSTVAAQALAAAMGIAAAALTALLLIRVVERHWALAGGLIVALLPSQVLWSSVGLRESTVWAVTAGMALLAMHAWRARGWSLLALGGGLLGCSIVLANLRLLAVIVAGASLAVAAAFSPGKAWRALRVSGALVIAAAVPAMFGAGAFGSRVIANSTNLAGARAFNAVGAQTGVIDEWQPTDDYAEAVGVDPGRPLDVAAPADEKQDEARDDAVTGSAPVPDDPARSPQEAIPSVGSVEKDGVVDQLLYLPRGVSVMLLEPLPWSSFSGPRVRVAQAELVLWYPLLALALIGAYSAVARREWVVAYPALVGGGLLIVHALTEGNFGTAFRHRGQLVWVVALFAGIGLSHLAERRSRNAASAQNPAL